MRGDQEVAFQTLFNRETHAPHDVLSLGLAVTRDRQSFYLIFLTLAVEFGAGQQGVPENINGGKDCKEPIEIGLKAGQVVTDQPPDQFTGNRHAGFRHLARNGLVFVGVHIGAVA